MIGFKILGVGLSPALSELNLRVRTRGRRVKCNQHFGFFIITRLACSYSKSSQIFLEKRVQFPLSFLRWAKALAHWGSIFSLK